MDKRWMDRRWEGLPKWGWGETVTMLVIWLIWCGLNALLVYEGWPCGIGLP